MRNFLIVIVICVLVSCTEKNKKLVQKSNRDIVYFSLNDSLLTYSTYDTKEVIVENIYNKKIIFKKKLFDICYIKPVLKKNRLYFPNSDYEFLCLNFKQNKILWKIETKDRVSNAQFINDDILILNINNYGFIAINSRNGKRIYDVKYEYSDNCSNPDVSPYPIVSDTLNFYLSHWMCNAVSVYRISNGKEVWNKKLNKGTAVSVIVGDFLFVGMNNFYKSGNIYLLHRKTGDIVYETDSDFEDRMVPLLKDHKIYYYTFDAKLNEFDVDKRKTKVIYEFNTENDTNGTNMYLLDDYIYFQDRNYILNRFNLNTYKKEIIGEYRERFVSGVYKNRFGKVQFLY